MLFLQFYVPINSSGVQEMVYLELHVDKLPIRVSKEAFKERKSMKKFDSDSYVELTPYQP